MELIQEISQKNNELNISVKSLRVSGSAYAKAEHDYKIACSKKALELKGEGMAVTLIDKVIYGIPEIAKLRFERDCAEVVYKANQEAINSIKLQIRILDSQISREWGSNE